MKFLIDEDLSPTIALHLCYELFVDAVAVKDRGLLGVDDRSILEYALNEDRILVTANISDFERFASAIEIHAGIVFFLEGDLLRHGQIIILQEAIEAIRSEISAGRDMINRVLYISIDGTKLFENLP
jgi:predicted nuclease of predicted toxin-antitoxin system